MQPVIYFKFCSKTRLAFKSLSNRIDNGESERMASTHTGIELTQAAQVLYDPICISSIYIHIFPSYMLAPLWCTTSSLR